MNVAAAHESDGGLVEAPVQDQMAGLVNTETAPPPFQPPVSRAETSPQTPAGGDDGYLLQAKEKQQIQRGEARYPSPAGALSRIISMGLLASVVVLMGLVFWEVFNFVGDVDDPLKDVTDPNMIPDAIEDMLVKGKSVAFVVNALRVDFAYSRCSTGMEQNMLRGGSFKLMSCPSAAKKSKTSRKMKQFLADDSPR
ncbi:hypothetical protein, conserved [Eimeria praecox]|uniref:Uncharacterized protein n=1 Tax=Eimeria praecox TaxID=51316 RepID=U6GR95_9EIME|nr:hypothetical protein, conserved [Eimeria praecox]